MRERLERIERNLQEAKTSTGPIDGRKMLPDLEYLLGLTARGSGVTPEPTSEPTAEPRIWRGHSTDASHWWWVSNEAEWSTTRGETLIHNDVFVPGCHPRPDAAIEHGSVLTTCSEVDWGVEKVEGANPAAEPRVWRGSAINDSHRWWDRDVEKWATGRVTRLYEGDVFVAACYPRPTEPPASADLPECSEVDWGVGRVADAKPTEPKPIAAEPIFPHPYPTYFAWSSSAEDPARLRRSLWVTLPAMSAMRERLERIERNLQEAKTSTGPIDGRKMLPTKAPPGRAEAKRQATAG